MSTYRKSIFDDNANMEIKKRIESLKPEARAAWGKMDVAQMLAHCSAAAEMVLGKTPFTDKSNFLSRTLLRWIVLSAVRKGSFGQDKPTLTELKIEGPRNFEKEKSKLLRYLDELLYTGKRAKIGPHPYFGKFSNQDWGRLQYEHFNHHLNQFSA